MSDTFDYDVFISHSAKDKTAVLPIVEWLRANGLRVSMNMRRFKAPYALILVFSRNVSAADWKTMTRHATAFQESAASSRSLLSLRLDDASPPDSIAQLSTLDWSVGLEDAYQKLLAFCLPPGKKQATGGNPSKSGFTRRIFKGHRGGINAASFSPDGKLIVSGADDNTLRLWRVEDGACIKTLEGHKGFVRAASFSPDGKLIVSGSDDRTLRLWRVEDGACVKTLKGHTDAILAASFSPDGKLIVSGAIDNTLRLWRVEDGDCIKTLEGHTSSVWAASFSPDGKLIVSGADDSTLRLWRVEDGACIKTLEGHITGVNAASFSPDGKLIVSGADDKTLRLWRVEDGDCIKTLEGHTSSVWAASFSPDGKLIVSGAGDSTLRLWAIGSIEDSGEVPESNSASYTNVKVLIVGDSGVGKSGLAMRLTEDKFEATISTHGAWATVMPLSRTSSTIQSQDSPVQQREVWLWDFGGQADYRLIHQLFMDETALAVLVFDPQKHNPFEGLGQWDRDLQKASRRPFTKLLVAGRCDRGGITVSKESIEQFRQERKFKAYLETSAETGAGCQELCAAILEHIDWSTVPQTVSPRIFKRLKDEILKLRDEGRVVIHRDTLQLELEKRMTGETFVPEQFNAVLSLLSGPGIVWQLDFGDFILLRPEWINAYAGAMVRKVRSYEGELGCIAEDDVLAGNLDYQDMKRLPRKEEETVLRAMYQTCLKYALCLRENTEKGVRLVFPAYFRRERLDQGIHPAAFVTYKFNGMLDEIYATLVVHLHHTKQFETDQLWRNAADFKTLSGQQVGLKLTRLNEGTGELTIYCDPAIALDTQVAFTLYAHEHLLTRATEITRTRHYVCKHCKKPARDYDLIAFKLSQGINEVRCGYCEEVFPLRDAIEERFASEEMRNEVRIMEEEASAELRIQSQERLLVGMVQDIVQKAKQSFHEKAVEEYGIGGEIEFHNEQEQSIGKRIYLQLKPTYSFLRNLRSETSKLISFLENMVPQDLKRILIRLDQLSTDRPSDYVPDGVSHKERVSSLFRYVQSSAGPGLPLLCQVTNELFPNHSSQWLEEIDDLKLGHPTNTNSPTFEMFDAPADEHSDFWLRHDYEVWLVIRTTDTKIRWMNITKYLKQQTKRSRQIVFHGEDFSVASINRVRNRLLRG